MAKNKTSYNIDVNLLARAQADFKNIESALAGLGTKVKGIVFDDKSSKKMESTIERITQTIPDLQAKLASGLFSDREIKEFSAGVKSLTKDVDSLSNQFRTIDLKKLGFDDGPLKSANDAIKNIKTSMTQLQSGLRLDTSGILGSQEFVKKLSGAILSAAKDGDSLINKLADIRTEYQQAADEQDNQAKQFQQKIVDTSGLETQLEVYKRLKQELEQSKKKSVNQYSPELTAALDEAKKIDDTYKGVRSHQDKIEVTTRRIAEIETQLTAEKEKQGKQIDDAAKLQKKAQDAAQRVADIDTFAAKNTTQFAQFDAQMSQLSKDLGLNEQQAESLRTALMSAARLVFGELITEIQGLGTATKITNEQIKEGAQQQKEEEKATDAATESFKNKITQIFGLYNIYQLIRRGIQNAYNSIKQLDQAMNEIAVVTNMTTNELWGQIEAYMSVARQYGVATQGVYEVSKLYYQQGRSSVEVTKLTAETLKMAKIAGLDYSKATDYMTVALNGFKLAAEDASMVVDVYSKLAAVSATDTEELAYAMSKTASIAESAGMSFQNTTVFLAQMIETTREAPENIGTAMKTIIARFQEMKKSPLELVEVEGEEISFNRVDKALQSIGMTLQDTDGQFKNLDDVIYELAGRWDGLDRNTQRYIATIVAGSRQQSRFLALMQDSERLTELQTEAQNSQDAGLIQYYKTLDSVESKLNQLKTAFQQFYMSIIDGPLVKGVIDAFTKIITFFNRMDPGKAILVIMTSVVLLRKALSALGPVLIGQFKNASIQTKKQIASDANFYTKSWFNAIRQVQAARKTGEAGGDIGERSKIKVPGKETQGGGMLGMLGAGLSYITLAISAISLISGIISQFVPEAKSSAQRIEEYQEQLERSRAKAATSRAEYQDLASLTEKWNELSGSVEKNTTRREEWLDVNRKIAEQYPSLITTIDDESNALINSNDELERQLELKRQIALEDAKQALRDYDARFKDDDIAYSDDLKDKKYELKSGTEQEMIDYRSAVLDYQELVKNESDKFHEWAESQMFSNNQRTSTSIYSTKGLRLESLERPETQVDWEDIQAALNRVNQAYTLSDKGEETYSVQHENFAGSAMHAVTAGALRAEKAGKTSYSDISWGQFNEGLAEIFLSSFINNGADEEVLKYIELEQGQTASSLKWDNMTDTQQRALVDYYTSGNFQSSPTYNDKDKTNINTLMEGIGIVFRSINTNTSREELLSNVLNLETYSQLQDPRLTTTGKGLLQSTQKSRISQALQSQGVLAGEEDTNAAIQEVVTQNENFINFLSDSANEDLVARLAQFQSDPMSFNAVETKTLLTDYNAAADREKLDPAIKTALLGVQGQYDPLPEKMQDIYNKRYELINDINKSHESILFEGMESANVSWEALNKIKEAQDALKELTPPGAKDSLLEDSADITKMSQETALLLKELYAEDGWSDIEKLILQSLEFTSYGQLQEAILFVKKSQPEEKREGWLDTLENQAAQYKVTSIELDGMFESADKSVKNLLEMVGKTYSPAEILKLVKDGILKESDIDAATGKIKDPKQFLTDQFEPIKTGLEKSIERAELEGDEISKAFYTNLLANLQNSIDSFEVASPYEALTKELLKSINFKEGTVIFDEASLKSYQDLGGQFANNFAIQADGTYKLVGQSIVSFYTNLIKLLEDSGIDATWLKAIQQSLEQAGKEGELEEAADARKQASDTLKNFNQADGTFTIDTETFNRLTSGSSDLVERFNLTGIDEYQYSGTFTDKDAFEKFYQELYPTEQSTAGFQESLDKAWNEYLESLAKNNQKKIDDAIKTISSSGVITYDESVLGELVNKEGWQQVGETVWQKTFESWDEVEDHINKIYKGENQTVIDYELAKAKEEWEEQRQEAAKKAVEDNLHTIEAVLTGIDTETGDIKIGSDLYEKLSPETRSFLTETGFGEYGLGAIEDFSSFMDGFLQSVDLTDPHAQAGLKQIAEELQQKKAEWYDAIYSLVLNMLQNVDETFAEARRGFSDKRQAMVIASKTGLRTEQNVSTGKYDFFDESGIQVEAVTAVEEFYKAHNINIKMSQKLVKEEHKGLKDLVTLQKQYAELQKEILELGINQIDQQIAKQYQLAKAIASLTFNPETYSFMSNSPTNEKLSPMYALMDNVNQAFNQLNQAGQKDGTISNQDLNAILDYVDPTESNQGLDQLRTMARTLEPPMQIALDGESIGVLQELVVKSAQKQVDDYNNQAAEYKKFLEAIDSTQYNFDEGKGPRYYNEEVADFSSLMTKLRETVEKPVLDEALQTAMKLLGPNFDVDAEGGEKKLVDTLVSVLTTEGILTDTQQEEAAQELASSMTKSNEAITNLTTAINTLTDVIGGQPPPDTEGTENLSDAAGDAATQIDAVSSQTSTADQALETLGEGQDGATKAVLTFPQAVTSVTDGFSSVGKAADDLATKLQNITFPKFQGGDGEGEGEGEGDGESGGSGADGGQITKSGKTLVGEFGPEIAFANGRYQILGARGPEFVNLPAGTNVFNHKDTARILRRGTSSFDGDGKSLAIGSYVEEFGRIQVNIDLGKWLQNQQQPAKPGGGGGGGREKDDKKNTAEFDRWYNYLRIIEDVEYAIAELQAARENLFGTDYTSSLMKEIKLIHQQVIAVQRYRDAQVAYLKVFEKQNIKKYGKYLSLVGGVLQIQWDKLNKLDSDAAEPIKKVIEEWEQLTSSISDSNQQLEEFKAQIQEIENEMRDFYLDIEDQIIEALKERQQRTIDNLQEELDMRKKVDEQYLSSLRESLDKERKLRDQAKATEDRAQLEKRVALLSRDTSGKSDLALAEAQRELQASNEGAYDTKREDFIAAEEEAARLAQERLQASIDLQTDILSFMNDNIQSFQASIDAWIAAEPTTLANFLNSWNTAYTNATPTAQAKHNEKLEDGIGKMKGYLQYLAKKEGLKVDAAKTAKKPVVPKTTTTKTTAKKTTTKTKQKRYKVTYEIWTKPDPSGLEPQAKMGSGYGVGKTKSIALSSAQYHANKKIGTKFWEARYSSAKAYKQGGLIDSTGLFMGHGSKTKPEGVLTADETKMLQDFMARMMKTDNLSTLADMAQTVNNSGNHIGQQFGNVTIVIQAAQDPKKTSEYVMEEFAKVARRAGSTTLP